MASSSANDEISRLAEKIIVALDYKQADEAEELLSQLAGIPCYLKVGLQLFYAEGPRFIENLKARGYRVFLDVKLHDIPNTVKGASCSITRLGVDMFNVHAAGGRHMMEAALEGIEMANGSGQVKPIVIAVTQLTSTTQLTLNEEIGIEGTVISSVLHYAKLARQAGLQGVVSSAWEAAQVKQACGADFITVTPGIRPAGAEVADQARIMTPKQAIETGSDYLVIGRPITQSPKPRQAFEQILKELIES